MNKKGDEAEIHVKLDDLLDHADPEMKTMLKDLIFEFHSQVMADPKARSSMKDSAKKLVGLGRKIIEFPGIAAYTGEESGEDRRAINYWKPAAIVAVCGVLALSVPWSAFQGDENAPPVRTCDIKGNIGAEGQKIYHVPGNRWYDKTYIEESKGERWFCSEEEAVGAGWRAPMSG